MKALVISDFRRPHSARPEAEIFLSLHREGISLDIMTTESEYAQRFRASGIRVIPFTHEKRKTRAQVRQIRKVLQEGNYDILHLLSGVAIKCGVRAARGQALNVIVYRGATQVMHWYDPVAYQKHLHPRIDRIVCNSNAVADMFRRQLFFKKSKAVVIHKGHDTAWYEPVEPADLRALGIPENAVVVICVANVRPVKGIPVLLDAFAQLPDDPGIQLLLIGEGMDSDLIASLPESKQGRIHALGYIENALGHIAASDVLVLPSLYSESLTKAVLEAMHLGVAPVITDLPGNAELLVDGESGFKVPPGNASALAEAMLRMCTDAELRDSIAQKARDFARRRFSHETTVKKTLELYRSLASD